MVQEWVIDGLFGAEGEPWGEGCFRGFWKGALRGGSRLGRSGTAVPPMGLSHTSSSFCSPMLKMLCTPPSHLPPALAGGPRQCLPYCKSHCWTPRVWLLLLRVCPALLSHLYSLNQGAQLQCHLRQEVPSSYIHMGFPLPQSPRLSSPCSVIWLHSLQLLPALPGLLMLSADYLLSASSLCVSGGCVCV